MEDLIKQKEAITESIKELDQNIESLKLSKKYKEKHLRLIEEEIAALTTKPSPPTPPDDRVIQDGFTPNKPPPRATANTTTIQDRY